jgi:hypothetical protein
MSVIALTMVGVNRVVGWRFYPNGLPPITPEAKAHADH